MHILKFLLKVNERFSFRKRPTIKEVKVENLTVNGLLSIKRVPGVCI